MKRIIYAMMLVLGLGIVGCAGLQYPVKVFDETLH